MQGSEEDDVVRRPPLPELFNIIALPKIQVGGGLAQLTRPQHCLVDLGEENHWSYSRSEAIYVQI